jgi:hypothetical protein
VVEAVVRVVVADAADRLAGDRGNVHIGLSGDLARDHHEARVDQALAGDAAGRVVLHHGVEDAIRDLVADLVGMALGDGLGGEQELVV